MKQQTENIDTHTARALAVLRGAFGIVAMPVTLEPDSAVDVEFVSPQAIKSILTSRKRYANSPQKFHFPKCGMKPDTSSQQSTALYVAQFCQMNKLLYVEPVFSAEPLHAPEVTAHCGTELAAWLDPAGALQDAGLLVVETLPEAPSADLPDPVAPIAALSPAKPASASKQTRKQPQNAPKLPEWAGNLTKGVQATLRRRLRHLAEFQAGTCPALLAEKYAKLGMFDPEKNALTRRGILALNGRF